MHVQIKNQFALQQIRRYLFNDLYCLYFILLHLLFLNVVFI